MKRIEIEFQFDMVFCSALYVVFSTRIYLQHIARPVESDRPVNIMFVHPSVYESRVYNCLGKIPDRLISSM